MRNMAMALFALAATLSFGTAHVPRRTNAASGIQRSVSPKRTATGTARKPGCYPGPAPYIDPCSSHEGEAICASDDTLGCKWTAEAKKCESKTKPSSAN